MVTQRTRWMGALGAALIGASVVGAATPASAQWHRGWGGPVAAGAIAGLALGAIAGSRHGYYPPPPPAYYPPPPPPAPIYYPGVPYEPFCHWVQRPVFGYYHEVVGYRRVQRCD